MPILQYVLQDPTDIVLQGEQMRKSVFDPVDIEKPSSMMGADLQSGLIPIVQDDDAFAPMNSFICQSILSVRRMKNNTLQQRVNAGIATPCGGWVSADFPPLLVRFIQATDLWSVSGVTNNSAGSPLAECRVVALETGRIAAEGVAEVGETISNGSGVYSIPVPLNTAYQLTAYKPGSPDVAGITRNDVTPAATG